MGPISNISTLTSYLTTSLQDHVFRKVRNTFLAPTEVCFVDLNRDISAKSQMKHVGEYDVYLDICLCGLGQSNGTKLTVWTVGSKTSDVVCKTLPLVPKHPQGGFPTFQIDV